VKLLLDTHVLIWSQEAPEKLGAARGVLAAEGNDLFVSSVSILEMSQMIFAHRIQLKETVLQWIEEVLHCLPLQFVSIDNAIAAEAYRLPDPFHQDPADRILVATARLHQLTLVTADRRLTAYPHVVTLAVV
jgi:PIN domain nuclease of toxin-antitoxin system